MALQLDKLEQITEEENLLQAEKLLDHGSFSFQKVDEKLFEFIIELDGQTYSTELLIKNRAVTSATCSCSSTDNCPHIIASGLYWRRHNAPKRIVKKKKPITFNTRNLIEGLDEEQLKAFAVEFSKKNREYSLYFRLEFLPFYKTEHYYEAYHTIARAFLSQYAYNNKINKTKSKHLLNCLSKFQTFIKQSFLEKDYVVCQAIIQVTSELFEPLVTVFPEEIQEKVEMHLDAISSFRRYLLDLKIAPSLKDAILEELQATVLRANTRMPKDANILVDNLTDKENAASFLSKIEQLLDQDLVEQKKSAFLELYFKCAEKFDLKQAQESFLKKHFNDPNAVLSSLRIALNKELDSRFLELFNHLNTLPLNSFQEKDMLYLHLEFLKKDKKQGYLKVSKIVLAQYFDVDLLEEVLEGLSKDARGQFIESLLIKLESLHFSIGKRNFLAYLHLKISTAALWEHLIKVGSIDLVIIHLDTFLESRKGGMKVLKEITGKYLEDHLGKTSVSKINEVIYKLRKLGAYDMASSLSRALKTQFDKRVSIKNHLA